MFCKITEKPWLPESVEQVNNGEASLALSAERIALRFFLAVVGVVFFLFTITFLTRSQYPDFQALAGPPWQPFTKPWQLWLNTGFLLFACGSLQWATMAARKDKVKASKAGIHLALLFAIIFILAQLLLWQRLQSLGYFVASNPANSYFYLLTGIHGLHLLGGIVALGLAMLHFRQHASLLKLSTSLSLCASYWHFLLVIWIVLFGLLASSSDSYQTIAAMCGFLR
jgi:cytochrome c oxidase subunit 3